jgi:multimeric flavodoxin WrbA
VSPEEKLIREGWEKQATYDNPRLTEMVEMYKEIGLEVHLEPFNAKNEEGCTGCMQLMPDMFKTIYTRKKEDAD